MNVSIFSQTAYENISNWTISQNKPNSNPNKANLVRRRRISNAPLHKQFNLLHLKGCFIMGHLGRYWQTKPKVSDELT